MITDISDLTKYGCFDTGAFKRTGRDRIGGYEVEGPCPFKCGGAGTDRLVISNGKYWCRSCHTGGYLENLLKTKPNISEKDREKARLAAKQEEEKRERKQRQHLKALNNGRTKLWNIYHKELLNHPEEVKRLKDDGISRAAIGEYRIGFNPSFNAYDYDASEFRVVPAVTFPHFKDRTKRYCINIRHRILDQEYAEKYAKYLPWRTGLPQGYFPAFSKKDKDFIVILEGEKKSIVLKEHGIPAIGLWGINNLKDDWIEFWKTRFDRRYILFDGDNWNVINTAIRYENRLDARAVFLHEKPDDALVQGRVSTNDILYMLGEI
jgi:hypothetical protein